MSDFERRDIPGLAENEVGFETPKGDLVAVEVSRKETAETSQTTFLVLKAVARMVDEDGETVTTPDGVAVATSPKNRTINVAAIEDGRLSVDQEIAEATRDALERFRRHVEALRAWERLPAASDEFDDPSEE